MQHQSAPHTTEENQDVFAMPYRSDGVSRWAEILDADLGRSQEDSYTRSLQAVYPLDVAAVKGHTHHDKILVAATLKGIPPDWARTLLRVPPGARARTAAGFLVVRGMLGTSLMGFYDRLESCGLVPESGRDEFVQTAELLLKSATMKTPLAMQPGSWINVALLKELMTTREGRRRATV